MIKFKIKFEVKFEIILVKLKLKSNVIEFRKLLMGKPLVWLQQSTHAVPLLATMIQQEPPRLTRLQSQRHQPSLILLRVYRYHHLLR